MAPIRMSQTHPDTNTPKSPSLAYRARLRVVAFVAPLLVAFTVGCGGSEASLSSLRCAGECQDLANPFLLRFELDADDPADVLRGGELSLRIDDRELGRRPLTPLIVGAQRIRFDFDLPAFMAVHGRTFTLAVKAYDAFGRPTNEVSMELVVEL